jgi:hypothetical protein
MDVADQEVLWLLRNPNTVRILERFSVGFFL